MIGASNFPSKSPRDAAIHRNAKRPLPVQLAQVGLSFTSRRSAAGAGSDYDASQESILPGPQLLPTFGLADRAKAVRANVQNPPGFGPSAPRTRTLEFAPPPSPTGMQQHSHLSPTVWRPRLLPIEEGRKADKRPALKVASIGPGRALHPVQDAGDTTSTILGQKEQRSQAVDKDLLLKQIEDSNAFRHEAEKPQS